MAFCMCWNKRASKRWKENEKKTKNWFKLQVIKFYSGNNQFKMILIIISVPFLFSVFFCGGPYLTRFWKPSSRHYHYVYIERVLIGCLFWHKTQKRRVGMINGSQICAGTGRQTNVDDDASSVRFMFLMLCLYHHPCNYPIKLSTCECSMTRISRFLRRFL